MECFIGIMTIILDIAISILYNKDNKGVIILNRDKLLEKAKKENLWKDERERSLDSEASRLAGVCSMLLLIVLIIYNWCTGEAKDSLMGILFVYMGIDYFFKTNKKGKIFRIASIFMIIAGLIYFVDPLIRGIFL
ncbi:DUF6442 family protein [Clostridium mobile]|uniref:DUF6442 family protein n=1 Tax=Clostridium mobile TaxID=2841512 RepID=UPI001FE4937E|nr:DUF6442 family protein [Clostridium mobile]